MSRRKEQEEEGAEAGGRTKRVGAGGMEEKAVAGENEQKRKGREEAGAGKKT